jgi:hypothetical protein
MLSKNPTERFPSVEEAWTALSAELGEGESADA